MMPIIGSMVMPIAPPGLLVIDPATAPQGSIDAIPSASTASRPSTPPTPAPARTFTRNRPGTSTITIANNSTGVQGEDFADVLVREDSDIQDAADLQGRTVGVNTLNNISDTTIRAAIEAQGGDPGNVEFVEIPLPDMPAALDRGEVDAIGSIEPFRTIALQDGARSAVSNYAFPIEDLTVAVYFTTEDVLAQEPETVEAFRAALEKSLQVAQDNPDEVRAVLPSYTQLDEELIDQLVLPAYPTEVNRQSVQELADLAVQHGRLTRRRGMSRAQVAVAHSILVSAWHMLTKDEPYQDLGADWLARRNDEAHARRLVAQLERLGHTVQLDTAS